LNQGIDKFSGKQWGYPTPDPRTFTSTEDVIQAYLTQVRFFTEKLVTIYNVVDALDEQFLPQPLLSALMDGCIERGRDCRVYKYFPKTIIQPVGHITVANSIAAMKKVVFEEKKVTMSELLDALRNNWEGKEELHRLFADAPKFGNDDDYVDLIARDIVQRSTDVVNSFKNIYGGHFMCDGTGGSSYFRYSGLTGATPDGRKDRDVFNDGTLSPAIGTDVKGPSAVLNSVGKIDHVRTFTQLFNQKFMPQFLADEYKDNFVAFMRTWLDLNIHHIQFNVIDKETLLDAKKNPEKYPKLVVRVAGFSAYFIDLAGGVQDQIIERTEQTYR
jgi:pyruvate-formate lyase